MFILQKGIPMKLFLIMTLALTAGAILAEDPGEAFENLVDAMYSGDAQVVNEHLSSESIAFIDMMLMMVRMQPEEALTQINTELDMEITPEELAGWTSTDLIETVLVSPGFVAELPPRSNISLSHFDVDGDSSLVYFNLGDYPEPFQLLMVSENGSWKIDHSVIQAEM